MTDQTPKILTIVISVYESGDVRLSAEGFALLLGVDVDDLRAHAVPGDFGSPPDLPQWLPPEWLKTGRRLAREAWAHTGDSSLTAVLEYCAEKIGAEVRLVRIDNAEPDAQLRLDLSQSDVFE